MCRFKLNLVVKALAQDSQEKMQRIGSTGSRFRGLPSFVNIESEVPELSLDFFRTELDEEKFPMRLGCATVAIKGGN
jgi:hypothetical protein